MTISPPPPAPSRQDPATFSDRADAFAAWLVSAVPQFNDLAVGSNDSGNFQNLTVSGTITGNAVTQSATDTTAGRLTKVGDFGLGSDQALLAPNNDLNEITVTGFYSADGNTANKPRNNTGNWVVLHLRRTSSIFAQVAVSRSISAHIGEIQVRRVDRNSDAGTWSPWYTQYSTNNILGTVSQSSGVPTGAIIQRGSNSNGEFVRFADGTQICWLELTLSQASDQRILNTSFTLPAAFLAGSFRVASIAGATSPSSYSGISPEQVTHPIQSSNAGAIGFYYTGSASGATMIAYAMITGRWF